MTRDITAIFDIDKTIYEGYSLIDFVEFMHSEGDFPVKQYDKLKETFLQYKKNIITYDQAVDISINVFTKGLEGKGYQDIKIKAEKFWAYNFNKVYEFAKLSIDYLHGVNAKTIAISGSINEIVYPLVHKLNFDTSYLTEIVKKNNVFSGEVIRNNGLSKSKEDIVKQIFSDINKDSMTIGFGDSIADFTFLDKVDIPVVVGKHDYELEKLVKIKGWTIIEDPRNDTKFSIANLITDFLQ
ncbi:haloacid dehalogenase-like hydrolase [Candidatus Woesebacteria bacterium]|nr:MAG: haloacid dehalogenase-like hydrolase [Candidatus Woesebacteria bacterium]